jgi:hypothetical protein
MQISPVFGAPGDVPPGRGELLLWFCGAVLFVLVLVVGFLAYLNPAMLIEFASLRLCG